MVCGQGTKGRLVGPGAVTVPCSFMCQLELVLTPSAVMVREKSCDPYSWGAFPLEHQRGHALNLWFGVMPICRVEPMPLPSAGGNLRVSTLMAVGGHCSSEPLGESFGVNETYTSVGGFKRICSDKCPPHKCCAEISASLTETWLQVCFKTIFKCLRHNLKCAGISVFVEVLQFHLSTGISIYIQECITPLLNIYSKALTHCLQVAVLHSCILYHS